MAPIAHPLAYTPYEFVTPINKDILPFGPDGVSFDFVNDYRWIFLATCVVSFYASMGIGANDVANSFATSVGSHSLTILQACIIAAIFEFLGATLLGAQVTGTISGGIVKFSYFQDTPDILMVGMFIALISMAFWLTLATRLEMPVSTTHSIVGAVIGFGIAVDPDSVLWNGTDKLDGVAKIVVSWFASPALAGAVAAIFFGLVRFFILRPANSFERVLTGFPIIVWIVTTINCFFIIVKGSKRTGWMTDLGGYGPSFGVAAGIGAGVALIIRLLVVPRMRERLAGVTDADRPELVVSKVVDTEVAEVPVVNTGRGPLAIAHRMNEFIHSIPNQTVANIHESAEKFEYRTELAFGYLQVFTACAMSFAHGANDVANAIGPLSAVVSLYKNGIATTKAEVPEWIYVVGGGGIVVGLSLYGWKIIRALGTKFIKMTPSRGACIELATAFVIVTGSIKGLPLSTTHTMVGAALGVGFMESRVDAVNLRQFAWIFFGWVMTLVVAGALSALLFSMVVYAPSMNRPLSTQNCAAAYGVDLVTSSSVLIDNVTAAFFVLSDAGADITASFPVV